MADWETYEIFALKYAEDVTRTRGQCFIFDDKAEAPRPLDFFVWVIRNANRTILVDTGFDAAEARRRERPHTREPHEALAMIDVDAAAVEQVVITHMHYDHAGTLDRFDAARFHLQEAEMVYATGPCMCPGPLQDPFTADHVCQMVRKVYSGRVVFHEGDASVAPGVTVHKIGGHSRGLQCVRVATERGPVVLASDAAHFYESYEEKRRFHIVVDVEDMLKGYDRVVELAASPQHVVPGHDPDVMRRYPAVSDALDGIAVRLDVEPVA